MYRVLKNVTPDYGKNKENVSTPKQRTSSIGISTPKLNASQSKFETPVSRRLSIKEDFLKQVLNCTIDQPLSGSSADDSFGSCQAELDSTPKSIVSEFDDILRCTPPTALELSENYGITPKNPAFARIQRDLNSPSASTRYRVLCALKSPSKLEQYKNFDVAYEEEDIITEEERATPMVLEEIMKNVVAYIEVRSENDNRSDGIKDVIMSLGAKVNDKLYKDTTHVIFKDGLVSTYQKAKKMSIPIVSVLWIEACKRHANLMDPSQFKISNLERYEKPELFKKIRRQKSMQPKADEQVKKMKALPKPTLIISPPTKLPTIRKRKDDGLEKILANFQAEIMNTPENFDEELLDGPRRLIEKFKSSQNGTSSVDRVINKNTKNPAKTDLPKTDGRLKSSAFNKSIFSTSKEIRKTLFDDNEEVPCTPERLTPAKRARRLTIFTPSLCTPSIREEEIDEKENESISTGQTVKSVSRSKTLGLVSRNHKSCYSSNFMDIDTSVLSKEAVNKHNNNRKTNILSESMEVEASESGSVISNEKQKRKTTTIQKTIETSDIEMSQVDSDITSQGSNKGIKIVTVAEVHVPGTPTNVLKRTRRLTINERMETSEKVSEEPKRRRVSVGQKCVLQESPMPILTRRRSFLIAQKSTENESKTSDTINLTETLNKDSSAIKSTRRRTIYAQKSDNLETTIIDIGQNQAESTKNSDISMDKLSTIVEPNTSTTSSSNIKANRRRTTIFTPNQTINEDKTTDVSSTSVISKSKRRRTTIYSQSIEESIELLVEKSDDTSLDNLSTAAVNLSSKNTSKASRCSNFDQSDKSKETDKMTDTSSGVKQNIRKTLFSLRPDDLTFDNSRPFMDLSKSKTSTQVEKVTTPIGSINRRRTLFTPKPPSDEPRNESSIDHISSKSDKFSTPNASDTLSSLKSVTSSNRRRTLYTPKPIDHYTESENIENIPKRNIVPYFEDLEVLDKDKNSTPVNVNRRKTMYATPSFNLNKTPSNAKLSTPIQKTAEKNKTVLDHYHSSISFDSAKAPVSDKRKSIYNAAMDILDQRVNQINKMANNSVTSDSSVKQTSVEDFYRKQIKSSEKVQNKLSVVESVSENVVKKRKLFAQTNFDVSCNLSLGKIQQNVEMAPPLRKQIEDRNNKLNKLKTVERTHKIASNPLKILPPCIAFTNVTAEQKQKAIEVQK